LIPETTEEALEGLKAIMVDKEFGAAGDEVVVEEYLEGEELSFLAFSDGYTVIPLPPAQDHKRALDGDQGPNTGGMGCYAPTPIGTKDLIDEVKRTILQPTIDGMRRDGMFQATMYICAFVTWKLNIIIYRISFRWYAFHWYYADCHWTQGP
jgi:phosphoribosylamine--glycine ligase/phosphoribosylformylglycinamidine cyclo-ligase